MDTMDENMKLEFKNLINSTLKKYGKRNEMMKFRRLTISVIQLVTLYK